MPAIETKRHPIVVGQPPGLQMRASPGEVLLTLDADGVAHLCHCQPEEAVQLGVMLIQLGNKAVELMVSAAPSNGKIVT